MKIHSYTKIQMIALLVMVVLFFITVLYSKGYFDFTFVDRPGSLGTPATQRQEQTTYPDETAYEDDYYGEEFGDQFDEYQDYFGGDEPYFPEEDIPEDFFMGME